MLKLSFSPQRRDGALTIEKTGNRIRINGELLNFNGLSDGDVINAEDVPHDFIVGDVRMEAGDLYLTVVLPHGPNPSQAVAFPEPIDVTEDGPIAVPFDEPEEIEEPADVDA